MNLYHYPDRYAIVSLGMGAEIPPAPTEGFYTIIRDKNETTLIVREDLVPTHPTRAAGSYRVVMLDTEFAFDVVGVLAKCSATLAQAGIPVMAYSSYKTDIFMFQERHFDQACGILEGLEF